MSIGTGGVQRCARPLRTILAAVFAGAAASCSDTGLPTTPDASATTDAPSKPASGYVFTVTDIRTVLELLGEEGPMLALYIEDGRMTLRSIDHEDADRYDIVWDADGKFQVRCPDCDGAPPDWLAPADPLAVAVDTVGGRVEVSNQGGPPRWRLVHVASLGPGRRVGEPAPSDFGPAWSVALDAGETSVYVAGSRNCQIKVFDLDGAFRRAFGRCGEGPGEFSPFFYSIAWVGDRLLAYDFSAGRIGEFSANGEWLGQRNVFGSGGGGSAPALHRAGSNEVYARVLAAQVLADKRQRENRPKAAFVGHAGDGETGDTIWAQAITPETSGNAACAWNPYAPRILQSPGPGGTLYSATSDDYRIAVTRGSDTLKVIGRDLVPDPISDNEWDAVSDVGASCEPSQPARPRAKPILNGIFFDATGRLWTEILHNDANHWELFDEGQLLARLPAPERKEGTLPALGSGHVATIRQDSLGVDYVDVWRIEAREQQREDAEAGDGDGDGRREPQAAEPRPATLQNRLSQGGRH